MSKEEQIYWEWKNCIPETTLEKSYKFFIMMILSKKYDN